MGLREGVMGHNGETSGGVRLYHEDLSQLIVYFIDNSSDLIDLGLFVLDDELAIQNLPNELLCELFPFPELIPEHSHHLILLLHPVPHGLLNLSRSVLILVYLSIISLNLMSK